MGSVVVRVLLEDDREEGEGIVEMGFVGEAGRLPAEEIQVVVFQDEAVLEDLQGLRNPADIQEDASLRRERDPVSGVEAQRAIEGLQRLLEARQSGEEGPSRIPRRAVHGVHAGRPVERLDRRVGFAEPFEGDRHLAQRIGIPAVEFEEPLARLRRGFVGSLESQEVPPNPDEVGPVWRKGGRPRDRRQRLLAFSDRVRQSGPARPCLRILAVRRREPDADLEGFLRPAEGLERDAQTAECGSFLRIRDERGLEDGDRLLIPVELQEACALVQEGF